MTDIAKTSAPAILLIGASRGLGTGLAAAFLGKGWHVVGTVRPGATGTPLHDLAETSGGRLMIEQVDINAPDQVAALKARLAGKSFGILLVNAGIAKEEDAVATVSTEDFVEVMITNALSPMRVLDALQDLVPPAGLVSVMSSWQGSLSNNAMGGHEVYRSSKAALNMFMKSYAVRQPARASLLMTPGWVRTALGGPHAPLSVEESAESVAQVLIDQQGKPGLQYLDHVGAPISW